jgi:hypothetical protein
VDEQIAAELNLVEKIRSQAGRHSIPALLGHSVEDRILVFELIRGLRMDRHVNWAWPTARRVRSVEAAMFQAGSWLRALHDSSFREYETIDLREAIDALSALMRRKQIESMPYTGLALKVLEFARQGLNPRTSVRVPVALNHGDFSLPNLLWNHEHKHLWVVDFELSSYRPILHDLCTLIATLRRQLLMPLTSPRVVQLLEDAFWRGYGPIPKDLDTLVDGLSRAWLFYDVLPRLTTLKTQRGWRRGLEAFVYKNVLQHFMVARVLRAKRQFTSADGPMTF